MRLVKYENNLFKIWSDDTVNQTYLIYPADQTFDVEVTNTILVKYSEVEDAPQHEVLSSNIDSLKKPTLENVFRPILIKLANYIPEIHNYPVNLDIEHVATKVYTLTLPVSKSFVESSEEPLEIVNETLGYESDEDILRMYPVYVNRAQLMIDIYLDKGRQLLTLSIFPYFINGCEDDTEECKRIVPFASSEIFINALQIPPLNKVEYKSSHFTMECSLFGEIEGKENKQKIAHALVNAFKQPKTFI